VSTNPIPIGGIPQYHEASGLRSRRDSETIERHWKKSQAIGNQVGSVAQNVHNIQRQLDRMRRGRGGSSASTPRLFPFKIYKSKATPDSTQRAALLATIGETEEDPPLPLAWRTFRVRAGRIGDGETQAVTGTDGANSDPDNPSYFPNPAWAASRDFLVPLHVATYFVYAERVTVPGTWYIMGSETAQTWGDGNYILLATINTVTDNDPVIRQYVRTDLPEPGVTCDPYA